MTRIAPINKPTNNKSDYKDPLNKKGIALMSYSNEVGTAISEIAPKLGTALWAPVFLYLGADIYDKYKNDKNSYDPSAKRALKQGIYQGFTTLAALPSMILLGQMAVSPLGRLDKSGISVNAKDAIFKHTKNVIDQAHGYALESPENFKEIIKKTLQNKINARNNEKNTIGFFKKYYRKIFTKRYSLLNSPKHKVLDFAEKNAEKTFEILNAFKNNEKNKIPKKVYKKYQQILPVMREMYKDGDYSYQATRTALKEFQKSQIFKNKILKTIGGIAALIVSINPVNNFVDKYIMKKYINPKIDDISYGFTNQSSFKNTFNTMAKS